MARLCIRILPNDHPTDAALTPMRTRLGDVVCVVDDSHQFSFAELNNGHYRIIDVPDVPQEDLIYLCEAIKNAEDDMIARRKWTLSIAVLNSAAWAGKTSATKDEIAAIVMART